MADDKTGLQRFVLWAGVTLSGAAVAWFVTWGALVAGTDPPEHRAFWIGATWLATAAFLIGGVLIAMTEIGPPRRKRQPQAPAPVSRPPTSAFAQPQRPRRSSYPAPHILQSLMDEGVVLRGRCSETIGMSNFHRQVMSGQPETTRTEVDAWTARVDAALTNEPQSRSLFRISRDAPSGLSRVLNMAQNPLWAELDRRIDALEQIIKRSAL